jgi:hypothetical protein
VVDLAGGKRAFHRTLAMIPVDPAQGGDPLPYAAVAMIRYRPLLPSSAGATDKKNAHPSRLFYAKNCL